MKRVNTIINSNIWKDPLSKLSKSSSFPYLRNKVWPIIQTTTPQYKKIINTNI